MFLQHYLNSDLITNSPQPNPSTNTQNNSLTQQNPEQDWILIGGMVMLFSQLGFGLINAGSLRYKNAQSIVIKVILGFGWTILIFWLFGYGFSYGNDSGTLFLGGTKLGAYNWSAEEQLNDYSNFVIKSTLAGISVAIVSGGAAEKITFLAWSIISIIYSGFVYPAIVHWTTSNGWIQKLGYKDFAGASYVFYAAGVAALVLSTLSKPRRYKFDENTTLNFNPFSSLFVSFGSIILFAIWTYLNGSFIQAGERQAYTQGLVAVNTLIAGAVGGFFSFVTRYLTQEQTSLLSISRGILTGLVVSSSASNEQQIWATAIIASIAGILYCLLSYQIRKLHIDDPVKVISIFLNGGLIGTIFTGLLDINGGLFYGKGVKLLGVQLLGLLIITIWVAFFTFFIAIVLKGFGILLIDPQIEILGIDKEYCDGEAIIFDIETNILVSLVK